MDSNRILYIASSLLCMFINIFYSFHESEILYALQN